MMLRIRIKGGTDPALPIDSNAKTVSSNFYKLPFCPALSEIDVRLRAPNCKEIQRQALEDTLDQEEDEEDVLSTLALDELMNEPAEDEDLVHAMNLLQQEPDIECDNNDFSYTIKHLGQTPVPIHQSRSSMRQSQIEMSSKMNLIQSSFHLPSTQSLSKMFSSDPWDFNQAAKLQDSIE
jgi:hypothetical protein